MNRTMTREEQIENKARELAIADCTELVKRLKKNSGGRTMTNEEKARKIAENAKLPLSMNETDEVLRAVNTCSKKGYFKTAVKYGALVMAQHKDKKHEQQKQEWITKACEFWEHKFPYTYLIDTIKEFVDTMEEQL